MSKIPEIEVELHLDSEDAIQTTMQCHCMTMDETNRALIEVC